MNAVVVALAGGVLIGLSAVLLMLANGRTAGVAGIVGGLFGACAGEVGWRLAFIVGLVTGPFAATLFGAPLPEIGIDASVPVILVARPAGRLRLAARQRVYQRPRGLWASAPVATISGGDADLHDCRRRRRLCRPSCARGLSQCA